MDFRLSEETEQLRADVREFLEEQITEELEERLYRTGVSHDPDFTKALAAKGWAAPGWPAEWGGQGRDKIEQTVIHEELRVVDAPTYGIGTTAMVAAVIREVGTDAQREAILPKALSGEIVIALGFTEPEAGSDVAAAACRAVRDGDDWVIDGQKMFTTNAQIADYVFLLARTNLDVPKHKGLTMFLVPMHQPGVEVQGVITMSGERTNISFYNDVHVSDEWRIGEVDGGWTTMGVALGLEHGSAFGPALARLLGAAEEWAKEATDIDGRPRIEDPDVREVLGRTAASMEVSRLLMRRTAWAAVAGVDVPAPGPMAKLLSSEALERRAEEMVDVMGPDALRSYFDPTAPVNGLVEYLLRFSLGTTIYAGTSEVHRNMIAQRALGLPRPR
jgi:alkylation response protein AidB-like acyl-CoA dehydrogenase